MSASPLMNRCVTLANSTAITNSDNLLYGPLLQDIIEVVFTQCSVDALIAGATQTVFLQQLALAQSDTQ